MLLGSFLSASNHSVVDTSDIGSLLNVGTANVNIVDNQVIICKFSSHIPFSSAKFPQRF